MLNAAAASISYDFRAAKNALLQSRAARFNLGIASVSVRQWPSTPPLKVPVLCVEKTSLFVAAAMVRPLPPVPIVRERIVSTGPDELAQTPVDPALISNSKHFAIVSAVSPIRFKC